MAETASCAKPGAGLASSACPPPHSSARRKPAPRMRHVVSARLRTLRPVEPPCGEPFDDLATVFPSRRLGCSASTSLARRRGFGFDARASATASLIGAGLQSLDAERRRIVLEGWHAYRDHGPRLVGDSGCDIRLGRAGVDGAERVALLAWLPLTDRELAVYEGGLFEDAPAHAVALLVRPPTIWSLAEAVAAERAVPARQALHAAAVRRDRASRLRADPGRAPDSAPSGHGQDRGPAADGRAPGCERHRRRGLRARRRGRLPRASGRRPPARPLRLERPRRSVHAGIRALTAVNCCYCDQS